MCNFNISELWMVLKRCLHSWNHMFRSQCQASHYAHISAMAQLMAARSTVGERRLFRKVQLLKHLLKCTLVKSKPQQWRHSGWYRRGGMMKWMNPWHSLLKKECKDFLRDSSVEFSMVRSGTKVYTEKEIVRQGVPDRIFFRTGYLSCVDVADILHTFIV